MTALPDRGAVAPFYCIGVQVASDRHASDALMLIEAWPKSEPR